MGSEGAGVPLELAAPFVTGSAGVAAAEEVEVASAMVDREDRIGFQARTRRRRRVRFGVELPVPRSFAFFSLHCFGGVDGGQVVERKSRRHVGDTQSVTTADPTFVRILGGESFRPDHVTLGTGPKC